MKDYLVALTEAVRLARLEIACNRDKDCRGTADFAVRRLDELLNSHHVNQAMAVFAPNEPGPFIVGIPIAQ